jgi:acetyltransferase-like isoleucine patch superfamily enzyme
LLVARRKSRHYYRQVKTALKEKIMGPDQWLVKQIARLMHLRYAGVLQGEAHKWHELQEQNRIKRMKNQLAACGEDITIRAGAQILVPGRVRLGNHVGIGYNSILHGNGNITLEDFTLLGDNNILATSSHPVEEVHFHNTWQKPILIKQNVWLAAGVIVLPGVTIGENSVIGAGAVVTEDIPPNSVAVGVPARVVRTFTPDETAMRQQYRDIRAIRIQRVGLTSHIDDIFTD